MNYLRIYENFINSHFIILFSNKTYENVKEKRIKSQTQDG
jgi:hypothetical protein